MREYTLRELCDQAAGMIATNSYASAIEIGRHILRYYPQHIETYVMLGEACVEQGNLREATELFHRALSADPEQVRAWLGLASACEQDELLDQTIWHLERAFELDPSNAGVRQELQTLYGQRHNVTDLRIKLNSAALARIYLRGGLYHQAISELRSSLEQHPDRYYLRLALALAYWYVGQRLDAAAVCTEMLEQLPHCLQAHLILGEIGSHGDQPQDGQEHLRIAEALDPENRKAQEMFGHASPLKIAEPTLLALEDAPPLPPMVAAPTIAASARSALTPPTAASPVPQDSELSPDVIPSWLRPGTQAGPPESPLAPPAAAGAEALLPADGEAPNTEDADLPAWMRAIAPAAATPQQSAFELASELPPDLRALVEETLAERIQRLQSEPMGELPEWMRAVEPTGAEELVEAPAETESAPPPAMSLPTDELRAILAEMPGAPADTEIPAWMRTVEPTAAETLIEAESAPPPAMTLPTDELRAILAETPAEPEPIAEQAQPTADADLPAWLRAMEPTTVEAMPEAPVVAAAPSPATTPAEEWQSLAEELPPELRALVEEALAEGQPSPAEPAAPAFREESAAPAQSDADLPAWLRAMEPTTVEAIPETQAAPEIPAPAAAPAEEWQSLAEELPPELRALVQEAIAEGQPSPTETTAPAAVAIEAEPQPVETPLPSEPEPSLPEGEAIQPDATDSEIPAWLRDLAEQQTSPAMATPPPEEAPAHLDDGLPAWLIAMQSAAAAPSAGEVALSEVPAAEVEPGEAGISTSMLEELLAGEAEAAEEAEAAGTTTPAAPQAEAAAAPAEASVIAAEPPAPTETPTLEAVTVETSAEAELPAEAGAATSPFIAQAIERLRVRPDDHEMRMTLARAWRDAGQLDAAAPHYERLIEQDQYVDMVVADLEKLVVNQMQDHRLWILLGDAYMRQGRLSDAMSAYRSALGH
jgi:tetratricopeptide (TPR) repeat protein